MAHSQDSRQGGDEFDPGYYQWRTEQMRALDDDYRAWRQGRNDTFSEAFTTWRDERGRQNARSGEDDDGERAPREQGNAITSQEQNENVAERAREEEQDK